MNIGQPLASFKHRVPAVHMNNFMHSQSQNEDLTGLITHEEDKCIDDDIYDDDENANTDEGAHLQPTINIPANEEDEDEDLEQFIQNDDCEDGDSIDESKIHKNDKTAMNHRRERLNKNKL